MKRLMLVILCLVLVGCGMSDEQVIDKAIDYLYTVERDGELWFPRETTEFHNAKVVERDGKNHLVKMEVDWLVSELGNTDEVRAQSEMFVVVGEEFNWTYIMEEDEELDKLWVWPVK